MKEYDKGQIGSIIDETTSEDEFNQYFKDRTELADTEKYTALGKYDTGLTSSISDLEKAEKDALKAANQQRSDEFTKQEDKLVSALFLVSLNLFYLSLEK